jgi:hypothetical protein
LESRNIIAPPIRTTPQKRVKILDQNISLDLNFSDFTEAKRSRYVDDARELIAEERVPIADARIPAMTSPEMPEGKFSTINFGNISSDDTRFSPVLLRTKELNAAPL